MPIKKVTSEKGASFECINQYIV